MVVWMSRALCALPLTWALALGRAFGLVWYYLVPIRRGVALGNVQRAFGESLPLSRQRQIVRRSFQNLCMYVVEGLRTPGLTAEVSRQLVDNQAMAAVDALLARGRGMVGITAHVGNLDLIGTSQAVRGYKIHALLKDIHWRPAQDFWQAVRQATGLGRIAPKGSGKSIIRALRRNEVVAFPVDQHMPKHRAIVCTFFGQLAATSPAPVRIAMATGAPILPAFIVRTSKAGHHRIHCEPEFVLEMPYESEEANVRHNTERLNKMIEGWVCAYPEQWWWVHKRWKVQDAPMGWDIPADLAHLQRPRGHA